MFVLILLTNIYDINVLHVYLKYFKIMLNSK